MFVADSCVDAPPSNTGVIEVGLADGNNPNGTEISYACENGYHGLNGSTTATCTLGNWTLPEEDQPACYRESNDFTISIRCIMWDSSDIAYCMKVFYVLTNSENLKYFKKNALLKAV